MPWKIGNPFSRGSEEPKDGNVAARFPQTMVTVYCEGCIGKRSTHINIRIEKGDTNDGGESGYKQKSCRHCNGIIEVYVYKNRAVRVYQSNMFGANRHETSYELTYQE